MSSVLSGKRVASFGQLGLHGQVRSASLTTVERWRPKPIAPPEASASPRPGWQAVERWKGRSGDFPEVAGCSALVRTLRRALQAGSGNQIRPVPSAFWRKAVHRGGKLAPFFSPEETCQVLTTLADARLQWKGDPNSTRGLQRFADHAAEEMGSFTPDQMAEFANALAKLGYLHQDLMQALSRTVEHTVDAERGRLSNDTACNLLSAFHQLSLLDEPVMKALSRFFCRRIIREPPTAQQTAKIAVAFSDLRARDLRLFNATTLALCRPGSIEELSWTELADVAVSYASLRLHSESLFARIRSRVCNSAGMYNEHYHRNFHHGDVNDSRGDSSDVDAAKVSTFAHRWDLVLESLESQEPPLPPLQLPSLVVAKLLEAQLHLEHLTLQDLQPLIPHLAHCGGGVGGRLNVELASLTLVFLGRGGHVHPWLWRRAIAGVLFESDVSEDESQMSRLSRLPGLTLLPLLEAFTKQLQLVKQLREAPSEIRNQTLPLVLASHVQVLAGGLVRLWALLGRSSRSLVDAELREAALIAAPGLLEAQSYLGDAYSDRRMVHAAASDVGLALKSAAAAAVRQLGGELVRRELGSPQDFDTLYALLSRCGLGPIQVAEDAKLLAEDSITVL